MRVMEAKPRFADQGRILRTYLRPQLFRALLLMLLLMGGIGLQLFNPQILKRFLDSATHGAANRTLALAAGQFLLIAIVQQALSVTATYFSENLGWTATNALRADLLLHCLRLDPAFHKAHTPGELIDRIDGDVTTLAGFFSQFVFQILGNILLLVGVLVLLWYIDWRIGLLMTGIAVLVLWTLRRIQVFVAPTLERRATMQRRSLRLYRGASGGNGGYPLQWRAGIHPEPALSIAGRTIQGRVARAACRASGLDHLRPAVYDRKRGGGSAGGAPLSRWRAQHRDRLSSFLLIYRGKTLRALAGG